MILLKLNEKYIKTYSFKVERSREKTFEAINLYLQNIEKGYSLLRTELINPGDVKIGDHYLEIAIRDGSPGYSFFVAGKITISIHETPDRNESMLHCKVIPSGKGGIILLFIALMMFSIGAVIQGRTVYTALMIIFAWTVFPFVVHISYKFTAVRLEDGLFGLLYKSKILTGKERAKIKVPKYGF